MAMKLVGIVILSTVLVVAEGSSLAPGAACLFDGQCESGLCRERSANVLDFAKVRMVRVRVLLGLLICILLI